MAGTSNVVPGATEDGVFSEEQLSELANKSQKEDFANKVIEWTKSAHYRCRTIRQQIERQWYLNMAFYIGRQNVAVIPVSSGGSNAASGVRLYIPPAPYYRSRPVINRIRPIIRTELSRLTAQKPSATIVPSTGEDQDLAAAQAGEQIWDSVYREKKIKTIFRQAALWMLCTGNGFIKTYWDPKKMAKSGDQGDFCYEAVTPFHLFIPDLLAQDIEDQPYVIHIQAKPLEWVKLNYPELQNIEPNVMEASDILNDSFLNLVGAADFRKDSVLCYEVWVKPGNVSFMPQGGMFTIVGDHLVQFVEGNIYEHKQYPFVKFDHIATGRFYADSVISDLVPVQREYNRTRGQVIEAKNRMSHPQIIAAQGSVDAAKINTEPGQVIQYRLGFPEPKPFPLQNLPPYVMQEMDRLLQDFEDISGQHQVSKGQVPAGVTAATAINFLQEQDETMQATTFDSVEEGFEKIGYQTLCYVKQYWTEPRTVKVVGRDGQFNVIAFQGASLKDNTDLRVEAGSALPTSKSAKQALIMDLMGQGFIPPEKGLELMDMGGVQRLYEEIKVDYAQASRENMRMAAVTQEQMDEYMQQFLPPEADPMAQMLGMGNEMGGGPEMGAPGMAPPGEQGGSLAQLLMESGLTPEDTGMIEPTEADLAPVEGDPEAEMQEPSMGGPPPVNPPGLESGMSGGMPNTQGHLQGAVPGVGVGGIQAQSGMGMQAPLIDPHTQQPLVDANGMPTEPPLIVPVNSWDAHQAHITIHNGFRKSQEFESLPPEAKALFEAHVNQHMMALGLVPGMPTPPPGQNGVTSGGMENGQVPEEMLQGIVAQGGSGAEIPPSESDSGGAEPTPDSAPPPNSGPPPMG